MHSNRMHTAALYRTGGLSGQRPPWTETPLDRDPCGQTDACENITLPQTSFAGGNNNIVIWYSDDIISNYRQIAIGIAWVVMNRIVL